MREAYMLAYYPKYLQCLGTLLGSAQCQDLIVSVARQHLSQTVYEVVSERYGIEIAHTNARFRREGWFPSGPTDIKCPNCIDTLETLRRPYTTAQGKQFYWCFCCLQCKLCYQADELPAIKGKLSQSSRHRKDDKSPTLTLSVGFFGAGPLPEAWSLTDYIDRARQGIDNLILRTFDQNCVPWTDWNNWTVSELIGKKWSRKIAHECRTLDLSNYDDLRSAPNAARFHDLDIAVFQNSITDIDRTGGDFLRSLEGILSGMRRGAHVVIIDLPYPSAQTLSASINNLMESRNATTIVEGPSATTRREEMLRTGVAPLSIMEDAGLFDMNGFSRPYRGVNYWCSVYRLK